MAAKARGGVRSGVQAVPVKTSSGRGPRGSGATLPNSAVSGRTKAAVMPHLRSQTRGR